MKPPLFGLIEKHQAFYHSRGKYTSIVLAGGKTWLELSQVQEKKWKALNLQLFQLQYELGDPGYVLY